MKKAEEYFQELDVEIEYESAYEAGEFYWVRNITQEDIYKLIKRVQIDAIEEDCRVCAEEAKVIHIDLTSDEEFDYTDVLIDDDVDIKIDKQSILSVADKLKKELE